MTAEALLTDGVEAAATRTSATPPALLAVIRAARDGDERAFEEIMLASERRVSLLAWRILGDAEEVAVTSAASIIAVQVPTGGLPISALSASMPRGSGPRWILWGSITRSGWLVG